MLELVRDYGTRRVYKAPALCVEVETINVHNGDTVMNGWVKSGALDKPLDTWLNVRVHPIASGCNPTVTRGGCGYVLDFEWILEATRENEGKILAEIERRWEHGHASAIKSSDDISEEAAETVCAQA